MFYNLSVRPGYCSKVLFMSHYTHLAYACGVYYPLVAVSKIIFLATKAPRHKGTDNATILTMSDL